MIGKIGRWNGKHKIRNVGISMSKLLNGKTTPEDMSDMLVWYMDHNPVMGKIIRCPMDFAGHTVNVELSLN